MSEKFEEVKSSVYLLLTSDGNDVSQGSAFCIDSNGIMVSNYHIFSQASKAILLNENEQKYIITEIIDYSKELDYIVFKIGPIDKPLNYLRISEDKLRIGENVFAVGNPRGLTQTQNN